jgi:hypothetical protein
MEAQAERLGDLQNFVTAGVSPLLPAAAAVGLVLGSSVIDSVADMLIR